MTTPLDAFEARWTAAAIGAPFFDTINQPVDLEDMPSVWASAIYHTPQTVDVSMGSAPFVQEDGTIIVAMFASAGTGRNALTPLVDQVRAAYAGWSTNLETGKECLFLSVNGPEDLDPQTTGNWWQLVLTVPYETYGRRTAPP
jgi:hypothetical protein